MARPMPRPAPVTSVTESLSSMTDLRRRSYPGGATPEQVAGEPLLPEATCAMLARMVRRVSALVAVALAASLVALPAIGQAVDVLRVERLPASLAGTWEFALGDPPGGVAELDGLPFRPVPVPGSWQAGGVPGHGTGWYRVTFDLDPSLAIVPLAFACPQIRDADEVFLDGQPVGRTGEFPPDYDKGTVIERIYDLPPSRTAIPGRHTLAVRVYNAGPRAGGITGTPRIDSVSTAFHARAMREAPRALLAAAFAALGLFSLFFFLRDRGQPDFLYFFLTTTGTAAFIVSWLSFWAVSGLPLTFLFRVGHAGMFAVPAMTLLLFLKFFERPLARGHRALLAAQGTGTVACLLWPRADDLYYLLPAGLPPRGGRRRRRPRPPRRLGPPAGALRARSSSRSRPSPLAAAAFDGAGVLGPRPRRLGRVRPLRPGLLRPDEQLPRGDGRPAGAAAPRRLDRPAHGPREPGRPLRPPEPRDRARPPARAPGGARHRRPRRLQALQRPPRARRRRPAPRRRGPGAHGLDPRHRPGRPLRRRRVRRPAPGGRRDPGRLVSRADPPPRRASEGRGRGGGRHGVGRRSPSSTRR